MRSSIYINEIGPNEVSLDFSASPSELIDKESMNGFAFQKTLEHLGLDTRVNSDAAMSSRLDVRGSVETIKQGVLVLQKHIGLIARYSADRSKNIWPQYDRKHIGSVLGKLVQRDLPALPDDATIMRAVGLIVEPFADITNDDGVAVYYARQKTGREYEPDPPALAVDGTQLGPFDSRDIGGFEIGWDGLRAKSNIRIKAKVPANELYDFQLISRVKEIHVAENLAIVALRLIEQGAEMSNIPDSANEEESTDLVMSFPRTLLKRMHLDLPAGISVNDVIVSAIKSELLAAQADPSTLAKVASIKNRMERLYIVPTIKDEE